MILVFGGTTEGRRAAEVLEEAGSSYYYSTKTGEQELALHHGVRTDGAMDGEAMRQFIREHVTRGQSPCETTYRISIILYTTLILSTIV